MSLIIDPGHGGSDPGAVGNGIIEEHYVLAVSLYQFKRFKELGVPVKITRTTDKSLSPSERTRIVKKSGMKHCLSNHVNAGGGTGAEFIHSKFGNSKWANLCKEEFKKMGQKTRRIFIRTLYNGLDYYFMHRDTGSVETIIAEHGFLDDRTKKDIAVLKEKQIQLAEANVKAYCRYAGYKYKSPNDKDKPSGKLYRVQAGAFGDKKRAARRVLELNKAGIEAFYLKEGKFYKVQAGAFTVEKKAKERVAMIKEAKFEAFYTTN